MKITLCFKSQDMINKARKIIQELEILNYLSLNIVPFGCLSLDRNFFNGKINVFIFEYGINETILEEIAQKHLNAILIVVSEKKEITYFYQYHIYANVLFENFEEDIEQLLIEIIRNYLISIDYAVAFISNKNILKIKISEIRYLNVRERKLFLHTVDSQFQINGSLKNYLYLCKFMNFRKISRNKMSNMNYLNTFIQNKIDVE